MSLLSPVVDYWYQDSRTGALFEIVAWDPDENTVQVQYLDGEITDFDLETWGELVLLPAAAPEDWRTAFELDGDANLDPDAAFHPTAWGSPLAGVEPETMVGVEDF